MKRRAFAPAGLPGLFLLAAVSLVGCPIYDHEREGCFAREDCAPGYSCDRDTGECVGPSPGGCTRPSDCGTNETCDKNGDCRLGDCSFADIGCVDGYECSRGSGAWRCVPEGSAAGGAGNGSGGEVSTGGDPSGNAGAPGGGSSQGGQGPTMGGFGGEVSAGGQSNGGAGGEPSAGGIGAMSGGGGA